MGLTAFSDIIADMKVTVIGTGFVGVVTAAVLAHFGNQVFALDIDQNKIDKLSEGEVPFYEPKLEDLVKEGLKREKLIFTTSYKQAINQSEVIILAVGTPSASDGTADLKFIVSASESLAPYIEDKAIVAIKSTVPPSTTTRVKKVIEKLTKKQFFVASTPEFLKEGSAVDDTMGPDRVVIGSDNKWVIDKLLKLHEPLKGKRIVVAPESAQMAKYAANAYLAQRITFINQIANLCEKNGADVNQVIDVIGADKRIGSHYWYPGLGYGGSCFPKDVKELAAYSRSVGEGDGLFVKLDELNEQRMDRLMKDFGEEVGGWQDKKIAVLGLSFKPNTDDMREAPSLKVIPYLQKSGASVRAYDPRAGGLAKKIFSKVTITSDVYDAIDGADIVMLLTEWQELVELDLNKIKSLMVGKWLIDTRNQYDLVKAKAAGLSYIGVGRS